MVESDVLDQIYIIASYRSDVQDVNRGKTYFESEEHASVGKSYVLLALECIKVWALWFPNTNFERLYTKLVANNVMFPEEIKYFKPEWLSLDYSTRK